MTSDPHQYNTWQELLEATVQALHRAAAADSQATAEDYRRAETLILSPTGHFPE